MSPRNEFGGAQRELHQRRELSVSVRGSFGNGADKFLDHKYAGNTDNANAEVKEIFGDKVFDTAKPTLLIQRILETASGPTSIILDSFAGSGTTAHAVLKLNKEDGGNRRFILCQKPYETREQEAAKENICDGVTAERVRRVMKGVPGAKRTRTSKRLRRHVLVFPARARAAQAGDPRREGPPGLRVAGGLRFLYGHGEEFDPRKMKPKQWFIGESREHDVFLLYTEDVEKLKDPRAEPRRGEGAPLDQRQAQARLRADEVSRPGLPRPHADHLLPTAVRDLPDGGALTMQLKAYQSETLEAVRHYLAALDAMRAKDRRGARHRRRPWLRLGGESVEKLMPAARITHGATAGPADAERVPQDSHRRAARRCWRRRRSTSRTPTTARATAGWCSGSCRRRRFTTNARGAEGSRPPYRRRSTWPLPAQRKSIERTQRFTPGDVEGSLCVLLLMLPAAARRRTTRCGFKDSGGFDAFLSARRRLRRHERCWRDSRISTPSRARGGFLWPAGEDFRSATHCACSPPMVVLDEGQKAYSDLARKRSRGSTPACLSNSPPRRPRRRTCS